MMTRSLLSFVLVGSILSVASADQIQISDIGGGLVLNSGPLQAASFGNGQTNWTSSSVAQVHASINASGINTNGRITFIAADTDHGLAFMALVDQQILEGPVNMGHVHLDTVGNDTNFAYVNNSNANFSVTANGANSRIATGDLDWNSNGGGAAFAWAHLVLGNTETVRFTKIDGANLGLNDPTTFQFLTWTGTAWATVVVPDSLLTFSSTGDFGFAATVVPAPSVLLMAGVPMLGASMIRRRAR